MNFTLLQSQVQEQAGSGWITMLMFGGIFVVMYFLMIRPQQKRQKELAKFRAGLKKGDKIITAGGIYATVKQVEETTATTTDNSNTILIEVDSNVTLRIDKSMVMRDTADMIQK